MRQKITNDMKPLTSPSASSSVEQCTKAAEKMKRYRRKLRQDEDKYKKVKEDEKTRSFCRRQQRTPEQTAAQREQSRIRMQKYRQKRREKADEMESSHKQGKKTKQPEKETRAAKKKQEQKMEEKRGNKRENKRAERARMSGYECRWVQEKNRLRMQKKRAEELARKMGTTIQTSSTAGYSSNCSKRKAAQWANKQNLHVPQSPTKFTAVLVISHMVNAASPNKKEALEKQNIGSSGNVQQRISNVMPSRSLCRIDVGRQPYFLQTTLREGGKDGFELVITDTINSWEGIISSERLEKLAKEVNMDLQEFIEQTKKALTRQNMGELAFEYQMKPSNGSGSEFSWKKVMTSGNIKEELVEDPAEASHSRVVHLHNPECTLASLKELTCRPLFIQFQLGSVTLEVAEDPAEAIQELFIFTIQNAASLRENINVLEGENERLSTERANALKRLEKCVSLHSEMEHELFSKFQVVLNDKKAKIRRLKQELKEAISNAETGSGKDSKKNTSHPSLNSSGEESNQEDPEDEAGDDEVSTDDESKSRHNPKKRTLHSSRVEADTSLILGDVEPANDTTAPFGKRRKRRAVTNKQTPSKPAIPKVSSGRIDRSATPSTPGTSEIGRLSRTASSKSSKSDPDADMLFDEL